MRRGRSDADIARLVGVNVLLVMKAGERVKAQPAVSQRHRGRYGV